jgi:hypothetical protein
MYQEEIEPLHVSPGLELVVIYSLYRCSSDTSGFTLPRTPKINSARILVKKEPYYDIILVRTHGVFTLINMLCPRQDLRIS